MTREQLEDHFDEAHPWVAISYLVIGPDAGSRVLDVASTDIEPSRELLQARHTDVISNMKTEVFKDQVTTIVVSREAAIDFFDRGNSEPLSPSDK